MVTGKARDPLDYIGQDGLAAARLIHFGDEWGNFTRRHRAPSAFEEESAAAFIALAGGGAQDPRYFTDDFRAVPRRNIGWCGSEIPPSIKDAAKLFDSADEVEWSMDEAANSYRIKTLSRTFTVHRHASGTYWDLMEMIEMGEVRIHKIVDIKQLSNPFRPMAFFEVRGRLPLWIWRERRLPPPLGRDREALSDWNRVKDIPSGYLELEPAS